jgi:hypothetical protein
MSFRPADRGQVDKAFIDKKSLIFGSLLYSFSYLQRPFSGLFFPSSTGTKSKCVRLFFGSALDCAFLCDGRMRERLANPDPGGRTKVLPLAFFRYDVNLYEIEHDEVVTHWDDYSSELLPKVGTSYPEKPGQVMAA